MADEVIKNWWEASDYINLTPDQNRPTQGGVCQGMPRDSEGSAALVRTGQGGTQTLLAVPFGHRSWSYRV